MPPPFDPMSADGNYSHRPTTRDKTGEVAGIAAGAAGAALSAGSASPIVAAGMAAYQVYSGLKRAEAIRRQARLTAQLNELNAQFVEYDAWSAEKDGATAVARYQSEIDKTVGEQRVALASQGVDVTYGTAAELQGEARLTGLLNQIEMQNQAVAKAAGLRRQANNIRYNSSVQQSQANYEAEASTIQGIAGAVNTGLSAYARK